MDEDVSYERTVQINAMVANGGKMPKDLSPAEQKEWKEAEKFYAWAKEKGHRVDLPGETAGSWK